jgi:hypothetical protein
MVNNTLNHWVCELFPSSGILNKYKTQLNLFPSSGDGSETYTPFGPLERANLG